MATAATISIQLEAQTATLQKGFAEAKQSIQSLDSNMSMSVAKGMAVYNTALLGIKTALGTIKGAVAGVMDSLREMDKLQKFADRLGMSADSLAAFGFAAEQTGSSQEQLNMGLQKMVLSIAKANIGTGEAVKSLDALGLSTAKLMAMTPDKQFAAIADRIKAMGSTSERTRVVMDIFGESGGELINLLAGGSDTLAKFTAEAEKLGLALGEGRRRAEDALDSMNRLKRAWGGMTSEVAIGLAPAVSDLSTLLAKALGKTRELGFWGTTDPTPVVGSSKFLARRAAAEEAALEAQKKLDAEMEKAREAMTRKGESVTASLRLPSEIMRDSINELNELVTAGAISWEIYNRGVAKAIDSLKGAHKEVSDFKTPAIGAVTRNSAEGFSAVQAAKRERDDSDRRHKELLASQAAIRAAIERSGIILAPVKL